MGDGVGATYEIRQWHQLPPDAMRATDELWQPPQGVDREATTGSVQPIQKFCHEIETYWNCTIVEAMPTHLRASTPYSLTMLLHLHRLASLSPKDMVGAHAALDVARSSRLSGAVPQSGEARIAWTDPETIKQDRVRKYAEPRIWEITDGLMLIDVRKACRTINDARRSEKNAAAEDAMDVSQPRSKKAEKRARYKANKAAKKHEARLQGSGRVEKCSGRWGGSKSDKKDNRQFVRAFEGLLKGKKNEVSESKRKTVARGFRLPSERFNPASIGSLGSTAQEPGEDGVDSNGGEMDLLE
ncbi:hypothetical protein HII31_12626 [Pseudocercospora fuligena]|uniref:Uncharacterized protein n=1 Tax=Pseudocercospora fuligena TaxID=685502 RepID=A0A8H6VCB6_9PEZI|nr:hypothetical protein HII31_12626 [Pseudocercospora fuligena]